MSDPQTQPFATFTIFSAPTPLSHSGLGSPPCPPALLHSQEGSFPPEASSSHTRLTKQKPRIHKNPSASFGQLGVTFCPSCLQVRPKREPGMSQVCCLFLAMSAQTRFSCELEHHVPSLHPLHLSINYHSDVEIYVGYDLHASPQMW